MTGLRTAPAGPRSAARNPSALFIKTYGCQMNSYDSERMAALMESTFGLRLVAAPEEADVILMNTCSVREKAEEKVYSELGRYRRLKQKRPHLIIGVGGCVAQQEGARIQQRAPFVDLVFGPQSYHRLPEMIHRIRRERVPIADVELPEIEKFDHLPRPRGRGCSRFVTVMEGCDKFCTFCVVPYTRGEERSRPVADILAECRALLDEGAVEITLLGQNVNGYRGIGPDGEVWDFAALLFAVAELPGLLRLRFTTSHPLEVDDGLIEAFAELPQLMPYLHLPLQSGSDAILKAMHRGHTADDYLRIVERLRAARDDLALSSDFIVGFPGERDEDFAATLRMVRTVGFDSAFCFAYSPRPGTPAAGLADPVPDEIKQARLAELLALMKEQTQAALTRQVGKTLPVLFDGRGRRDGDLVGRTPDFKIVHARGGSRLIGHEIPVTITRAYGQSLRGEIPRE
ncbi:MAG: tRNA (N6-isopentenyl adenosine(37)-C2)-methylthiotransferase MiaB [Zetaproteobacteria bacterium]|nr:MAG: tRNA (N6-isopentenyl adenosine(37)-C2)-methylthiotransferase MiaB [Zetaproteobacteria bacterium]